jgi:hypothetical protein
VGRCLFEDLARNSTLMASRYFAKLQKAQLRKISRSMKSKGGLALTRQDGYLVLIKPFDLAKLRYLQLGQIERSAACGRAILAYRRGTL